MRQISPSESFDIVYFLRNHTDATTYYIRAVVYDARTGDVLQTVPLDQSPTNSRLFIKTVQSPADPTGYGRSIVAVASVYADSGYTTKSTDYEEQEQSYFVKATAPMLGGGGVDYSQLAETIERTVRKELERLRQPKDYQGAFDSIFGAIGTLQRELNRVPKETFDAQPVMASVAKVQEQIRTLTQNIELAPIEKAQVSLHDAVAKLDSGLKTLRTSIPADHSEKLDEAISKISEAIRSALAAVVTHLSNRKDEPEEPAEPLPSPIDISHLFT